MEIQAANEKKKCFYAGYRNKSIALQVFSHKKWVGRDRELNFQVDS